MSLAVAPPSPAAALANDPIRVMVVDDATVVRGTIMRWIEAELDMQVVASLRGGREAIEQVERKKPDVVILDITMPDVDGITALPLLLERKRDLIVLMLSTLTRRNAEISLRALSLGAADYIPKPESNREFTTSQSFQRELIDKIRALGARRKRGLIAPRAIASSLAVAPARADQREAQPPLDAPSLAPGGPQALNAIVAEIGPVIDQAPVLITQHMPPTFTAILAEHLTRTSGRQAGEAEDGEPVRAGRIYVARGGRHMRVVRRDGEPVIALDDGPLVKFCKPAVDPLFSSAAAVWGAWSLALVLTGMGSDGACGAGKIVAVGGGVIVQDEASSVVWGMPGTVAHAGLASAVLSLDQIGPKIVRIFSGGRS